MTAPRKPDVELLLEGEMLEKVFGTTVVTSTEYLEKHIVW
jgi:hypothetical protein